MKKIIDSHITVDELGQIKSTEKVYRFKSEEPNYIKIYLRDISYFYEIPKGSTDLIYELFNYVNYNTHEIIINIDIKKRIRKLLDTTVATLDNNLSKLIKKGILDKTGTGVYNLNPYLFGKGDWKSIKELRNVNLHLEIVYDSENNKRELRGKVSNTPSNTKKLNKDETDNSFNKLKKILND